MKLIVIALVAIMSGALTFVFYDANKNSTKSKVYTQPEGLSAITKVIHYKDMRYNAVYMIKVDGGRVYFGKEIGMTFVPDKE